MKRRYIVVGGRTSHGGKVLKGSIATDSHGRAPARVGDLVSCPDKGHGRLTRIACGDPGLLIDGLPAAREGDRCACGARLGASQSATTN